MATNKVYASYQEVIDMHTEQGHVTAIGIHTPTGSVPREMFNGFFEQFKRMKYLGCSLSFVPVATLPADPLNVSLEAGEPGIDPRDLVNPIMFHGCHGDDLGGILNKLYGDDDEISDSLDGIDYDGFGGGTQTPLALTLQRLYYKALTDNSWKKAHPQKGFRKSGLRPLVYSLAANRQIGYGAEPFNAGDMNLGSNGVVQVIGGDPTSQYPVQPGANITSQAGIQFMTPRLTSLGWIETKNVITSTVLLRQPASGTAIEKQEAAIADAATRQTNYAELPKLFMGVILLAPAYKTEMYFRVIINHHFAFKDFRGISFKPEVTGVPTYYDRNDDVFDINPTFPDLPSDFSGFGSDGGDNGAGDVLTYETSAVVGDNLYTYYTKIKSGSNECSVVLNTGSSLSAFDSIMFDGSKYYPARVASGSLYWFDSETGLAYGVSTSGSGTTPSTWTGYTVSGSIPSDYLDVITSGEFTLEARD